MAGGFTFRLGAKPTGAPPPAIAVDDPNWQRVGLMLDVSNAADSSTITDKGPFNRGAAGGSYLVSNGKMEFNGTNQFCEWSNTILWTPHDDYSWELFGVVLDTFTGNRVLISHYSADANAIGWYLMFVGNSLQLTYSDSGSSTNQGAGSLGTPDGMTWQTGVPYDIAIVRNGASIFWYVDGELKKTANNPALFGRASGSNATLRIGARADNGVEQDFLDGRISAVRIGAYNRTSGQATYPRHALQLPTAQAAYSSTITYIEGKTLSVTSGGGSGVQNFSNALLENDVVLVWICTGGNGGNYGDMVTTGYTQIAQVYQSATGYCGIRLFAKRMGSSPDASWQATGRTTSNGSNSYTAQVFRGVDTTTMFDVASVGGGATTGTRVYHPAITPITTGAKIASCVDIGLNAYEYFPSRLEGRLNTSVTGSSYPIQSGVGWADWSGSGEWGTVLGINGSTSRANCALTCALRPAS